ncbi:AAA-like domain-containing protein [Crocosphaera sp.]|uniref:AAA-like domain-containing protein n=1 Tax=Crocosphaera sp. TaxID=2729996 RepID=UPI00262BA590|nr:AAA-like domain-containing protein [Crocosphaera sp.]MDJ0581766.1 AAA-like domain-containing protein [Crocosphaera sp.]
MNIEKIPQIFIAHASEDKPLVRELYSKLVQAGYKPWLDEEELLPGQNWTEEIPKALKNSDLFIACLSSTSISKRGYIQREFKMAMEMLAELPAGEGEIYIIPLKLDDCKIPELIQSDYGLKLKNLQWLDYWKPNSFEKLIKAIERQFGGQETKDTDNNNGTASPSDTDNQKSISLEIPEGQVPLDSLFYLERPPIESDCYQTILQPGALIRVKAPRQMGKSSLMARILSHAKQADYQTASLNFQLIDDDCLKNLDQFLQWFCASISDKLELPALMEDYWKRILGSKKNCTNYFQKYLLSKREVPLVLGLDEVDQVFRHPEIATGFLGLLRAWHDNGKDDPVWQKLRLVIFHSKEVDIPVNQSPFNVGFEVKLPEFTPSQVEDLATRHGLHWTVEEKEGLIEMCGGHPYLIRVALYEIARERMTWQEFLSIAPTEEGIYQDHLRRHLLNLEQDESLLMAYKQVVATEHPVQIGSSEGFKLKSMGLVKFQGNKVMPLCELYRRYFRNRLGVS